MNRWISHPGFFGRRFSMETSVILKGKIGHFKNLIFRSPIHFSFFLSVSPPPQNGFNSLSYVDWHQFWGWRVLWFPTKTYEEKMFFSFSPIHFFDDFSPPIFSMFFSRFSTRFFRRNNVSIFWMKMDSAGGVTSIGTTFEVGVCFGYQKKLKKRFMAEEMNRWIGDRFTDSPIQSRRIGE